jgi:hypothetical protein
LLCEHASVLVDESIRLRVSVLGVVNERVTVVEALGLADDPRWPAHSRAVMASDGVVGANITVGEQASVVRTA